MNTLFGERELAMKEFSIKFNKMGNEEVKMDYDDFIEDELKSFRKVLSKNKSVKQIVQFGNWFQLYKTLNYDIIDNLTVTKVDKVNVYCARVELMFKGKVEYDVVKLNKDTLCCEVFKCTDNKVNDKVIRRALIPSNGDEALIYFEREITKREKDGIEKIIRLGVTDNNTIRVTDTQKQTEVLKSDKVVGETKEDGKMSAIKDRIMKSLMSCEIRVWEKHVVNKEYLKIRKMLERKLIKELKDIKDAKIRQDLVCSIMFPHIANHTIRMMEVNNYLLKIK